MDKISIEEALNLLGYKLTEKDYSLVLDSISFCTKPYNVDTSMIDFLSDDKKNSVGLIFCTMPMNKDLVEIIIYYFLRVKKIEAFV